MGRIARAIKTNFTSGELDPRLAIREDIKHYYQGADKLRNVEVIPQGGCVRRPGQLYIDVVAPQITDLDLTGDATAPNGGTAANAVDEDAATQLQTNQASTTDPFVIVQLDLGVSADILFADVHGLTLYDTASSGTNTSDEEVRWQSSDDAATWTDFGDPFDSVTAAASINQRRSIGVVTARYWRLVRVGATDLGTYGFQLDYVRLWSTQSGVLSEARVIGFKFSNTQTYLILLSDRNGAVYLNGQYQADFYHPLTSAQLANCNWTQSLDTLILFHQDVQMHSVQRSGAHDEWDDDVLTFDNIPTYEFATDDTTPAVAITPSAVSGSVTLTAGGAYWSSSHVGTYVDGNQGRARITEVVSTTVARAYVTMPFFDTSTIASGAWTHELGWEAAWSDARGWPGCGVFHEGRFWVGGSASLPSSFGGSRADGQLFNFDLGTALDDDGIFVTLDADDVAAIYNINSGRHLQLFTESAEFYVLPNDAPITPTTIVVKRTTSVGSKGPGIRVVNVEGAVLFLQRQGKALREFLYEDLSSVYQAQNIALLSAHLFDDPVDLAYRKATSTNEGDLLMLVNTDGTLAVLQTLRDQDITAWTLWETDGKYLAAGVDLNNIYIVVERTIAGIGIVRYLELFDSSVYTDAAVQYDTSGGLPATVLGGLDHLEGATVKVRADNAVEPDEIVASGQITIELEAETTAEVGLDFPDVKQNEVARLLADGLTSYEAYTRVYGDGTATDGYGDGVWIKDMPIALNLPDGTLVGERKRIIEVTARIFDTASIWVGANGDAPEEVTFREFGDDLLDEPPPTFTGDAIIQGLLGFSYEGQVEIVQREPMPMTLLGMAKKVTF